ncbi:DUF6157 family protein [Adhaeribacter aquaticus]|uniref:DUF6157 family protein n=1 Tax=Adhaeribacter aquaticus TaxID=299567 RepID=UPI00041E014C|nr:DUF6157 family protein [Adhaeribacter aquaticus]
MSYTDTLIKVAADCPVNKSEIPVAKMKTKPIHVFQYELLLEKPYAYNHEELVYQVYVRQKEIPVEVLARDSEKIKQELFSKGHPCMRASSLTKRYGWGAHYNEEGKIAIYPMESEEYKKLVGTEGIKVIPAMKSKR